MTAAKPVRDAQPLSEAENEKVTAFGLDKLIHLNVDRDVVCGCSMDGDHTLNEYLDHFGLARDGMVSAAMIAGRL